MFVTGLVDSLHLASHSNPPRSAARETWGWTLPDGLNGCKEFLADLSRAGLIEPGQSRRKGLVAVGDPSPLYPVELNSPVRAWHGA